VSTSKLPRDADRVAILINPKAGPNAAQPLVERLVERLRRQGFKTEVFSELDAATAQANRWHAEGCLRTLIGAGGDGTAAALVNGTVEGVPIALFPAGNCNLLARYYGLSNDPEVFCQTICDGTTVRVDAGLANGRIFLLMASCGFDAEVVRRVHERRTGHVCNQTYFKPIVESIWSYPYPEIRVHCEDDEGVSPLSQLSVRWLFAFNLPCYAGDILVAPHADGSDGLFDVCGFRYGGLLPGLWSLLMVLARQHHRIPGCTTCRTKRLRLTSEAEVPYQLDGDPGGVLPLDLQVLPGRLTLVVPMTIPMDKR